MKLKVSKNSLFAILLRSPWWASAALASVTTVIALVAVPKDYQLFGLVMSAPFWLVCVMAAWRQWRLPSSEYIEHRLQVFRTMSWQEFSAGVEQALKDDGFTVTRLNAAEADFAVVSDQNRKGLVASKRWKVQTVGIEPLRELHQAMLAHDAEECIYITTGTFTPNATQFAADHKMRLLSGGVLVSFLRRMKMPLKNTKA